MLRGLTLTQLAQKLESEKGQTKDMIVSTGAMELAPYNGSMQLDVNGQGSFPLRPLVHDQIADHTKIPLKYYKKMQEEAPELLADNVNTWFRKNPKPRMLRTMAGTGRALLSNRYLRVENHQIAEVALNALVAGGMRVSQIVSTNVTEQRLYIQAIMPGLEATVKGSRRVGDIVQGGVVISNSEVGMGRVDVSEFDYLLACLNGMVTGKLLKKTHLGGVLEDDDALLKDDTRRTMDNALMLQIRDMITAAVSPERFQKRVEKMSALTSSEIKGDPTKAIEAIATVLGPAVGLTENDQGSILNALVRGGDVSAWGLINAVTAQANTETDYDRAVTLEAAGGKLLELGRDEWTRILDQK